VEVDEKDFGREIVGLFVGETVRTAEGTGEGKSVVGPSVGTAVEGLAEGKLIVPTAEGTGEGKSVVGPSVGTAVEGLAEGKLIVPTAEGTGEG